MMPIDAPLTTALMGAGARMMGVVVLVGLVVAAGITDRGGHVQAGVEAQRSEGPAKRFFA